MTATAANIIDRYQGVAPTPVIKAVQKAANRTGADFAFLMEKASTESSFNPGARARSSSATGLFQFIESTWLGMVKQHGHKYGLGKYADQIEMKNGRPCVADCDVKNEILALRRNPEISALMAGEFSAENKSFLERNTSCDVGATELYLAHFMGASGAAKFLNCRDVNGDAGAAQLFPAAARANKNVFYDRATGRARTLDEIYDRFAEKFGYVNGKGTPSETTAAEKPQRPIQLADKPSAAAPAPAPQPLHDMAGGALPLFDDANENDDIIWNDDPRFHAARALAGEKLSPAAIIAISEMTEPGVLTGFGRKKDRHGYNS